MKKMLYVVTMYRWGDRKCHSYVLGAYSTKTKAEKAGQKEKEYRGGSKYYPECVEVPLDAEYGSGFKTIVALEHNPYMARHPTPAVTHGVEWRKQNEETQTVCGNGGTPLRPRLG